MAPDIAAEERRLLEAALGELLVAAGTFHLLVDNSRFWLGPEPARVERLLAVLTWTPRIRRMRQPMESYWALTSSHLHVARLHYAPRLAVRGLVGHWRLTAVHVEFADLAAVRLDTRIDGFAALVQSEGSRHDWRERELIEQLLSAAGRSRPPAAGR